MKRNSGSQEIWKKRGKKRTMIAVGQLFFLVEKSAITFYGRARAFPLLKKREPATNTDYRRLTDEGGKETHPGPDIHWFT